ncbi:beta-phosphoglucomutase [Aureitalea marina]|uniref:Beta-phosphoglucomutase n=1 Tax=Aureitalea marina TaxID=930804 RepID=A0A2S7KNE5_9FLAO|nr:beta-phosphoglucomutase [Aureitalea marina]PQB04149.1 beta-phosphoglucomutase [Aureitalea marina]
MSNKKGFIFDLDGVIVDTAQYHYLAWKELADSLGISFSEVENEQLKGVSRIRSLEKILEMGNMTLAQDEFDRLITNKNADYLSYVEGMTREEILADVPRVLRFLSENGQRLALGSASKNARTILGKVGLMDQFDTIVDGTQVSKAKPDPEVFIRAAKELHVPAERCIVFEDALAGIQAANNAGMLSIGIGDPTVLREAAFVFSDFTKISNEFLNELIQA